LPDGVPHFLLSKKIFMAIFQSMLDDLRAGFRAGSMVRKLILINFLVFVVVQFVYLGCNLTMGRVAGEAKLWSLLEYVCMSSDWREVLWRPWSVFTNFFLHQNIWHLIGNLIWLHLFGTIVGDLIGNRRVLPIYLLGGLAGSLVYFVTANLSVGIGDMALGASAAVMAFSGAGLMLAPDYRVGLLLLGEVKLKYVVFVMVLLDLVGASGLYNAGGHAAHLGGFLMGIAYVHLLRDGRDLSEPINRVLDRVAGWFDRSRRPAAPRPRMKVVHRQAPPPDTRRGHAAPQSTPNQAHQEKLDAILDKIKQQGFENLTQEEKDFLYEASKK
jgi:membrane associated rhomboid family serine protease